MSETISERIKWDIEGDESNPRSPSNLCDVHRLLEAKAFTSYFQPIISLQDGSVYGYEALARVKPGADHECHHPELSDIGAIFRRAGETGVLPQLDALCRENAVREAARLGLSKTNARLFINVCPITLTDPARKVGATDELVEACGLSRHQIIFELTEEVAVQNYKLFRLAVAYYRDQGYQIAIDDFGVGYGGLKMLSMIEPDFVKIDRHFISNIDRALVRFNLVDMLATACHRMGIRVIAEGIERPEELAIVSDMGIEMAQGFFLARPSAGLASEPVSVPGTRQAPMVSKAPELTYIGQVVRDLEPVAPSASLPVIFKRFIDEPSAMSLPVVDAGRVLGMLQRGRFFEADFLGRFGYAHLLNAKKNAAQLAEGYEFLSAESNSTLEHVSQRLATRGVEARYDDLCVTRNGKYSGVVPVSVLLEAITQRSLLLAQGTNPLTKMPGNEFIQRKIEMRLSQRMHFDICYIDIDHFKPYNDHYGFERGDQVILTMARLIEQSVRDVGTDDFNFCGHIGGDDFIVMCRPQKSLHIAQHLQAAFVAQVPLLHHEDDLIESGYTATNRRGEQERFPLLSLSMAILSTEVHKIGSYAEMASLAAEVKKAAKKQSGMSIVRDRRLIAADV